MEVYIPRQGDIIAITFDPQSGHEQKGRRPALVVSKDLFNRSTGLAIVCPLTNTERGFPFHVPVPGNSSLTGFIMVEQVKSVDFHLMRLEYEPKSCAISGDYLFPSP
ncbi:MAG: type II toxin-antitoxin system PemK/MazF family toxin [Deltaproteobacteria bacterium]|jgi:mRNA interferase MazF|nr:type II toxin-antitoxin system PemK/MazF family toxin [Deltaproteobacteria bacterium]